jgi:hypothetical protein
VLGGGFNLWLGDNIAILSMVKQANLLFLTGCTLPCGKKGLKAQRVKVASKS